MRKVSDYERALEDLKKRRCVGCWGTGTQDDAELGDIYYNEWACPDCCGTGYQTEKKETR